jgi:hypothetical protein
VQVRLKKTSKKIGRLVDTPLDWNDRLEQELPTEMESMGRKFWSKNRTSLKLKQLI